MLTQPIGFEAIDPLSESESHRRQATSKAKSPIVLISPVQDKNNLDILDRNGPVL